MEINYEKRLKKNLSKLLDTMTIGSDNYILMIETIDMFDRFAKSSSENFRPAFVNYFSKEWNEARLKLLNGKTKNKRG